MKIKLNLIELLTKNLNILQVCKQKFRLQQMPPSLSLSLLLWFLIYSIIIEPLLSIKKKIRIQMYKNH